MYGGLIFFSHFNRKKVEIIFKKRRNTIFDYGFVLLKKMMYDYMFASLSVCSTKTNNWNEFMTFCFCLQIYFAIYKNLRYQSSHPHGIYHETPQEDWISLPYYCGTGSEN